MTITTFKACQDLYTKLKVAHACLHYEIKANILSEIDYYILQEILHICFIFVLFRYKVQMFTNRIFFGLNDTKVYLMKKMPDISVSAIIMMVMRGNRAITHIARLQLTVIPISHVHTKK